VSSSVVQTRLLFSPFLRPSSGMPRDQKLNPVFKDVPWPLRGRDLAAVVATSAPSSNQHRALESRSGPLCSEGPAAASAKGTAVSVRPAMASAKGTVAGQRPMAASAKGTAIGTRSFLVSEGFAIPRVPEPRHGQGCGNAVAGVTSTSADKRDKVNKGGRPVRAVERFRRGDVVVVARCRAHLREDRPLQDGGSSVAILAQVLSVERDQRGHSPASART
jgi:hypothetical protein